MAEVVWSEAAAGQFRDLLDYIGQLNPMAAAQIGERLHALAESLAVFPNRGRPGIELNTREMTTVPPYIMTYQVVGDLVAILDIRHGRQMPRRLAP